MWSGRCPTKLDGILHTYCNERVQPFGSTASARERETPKRRHSVAVLRFHQNFPPAGYNADAASYEEIREKCLAPGHWRRCRACSGRSTLQKREQSRNSSEAVVRGVSARARQSLFCFVDVMFALLAAIETLSTHISAHHVTSCCGKTITMGQLIKTAGPCVNAALLEFADLFAQYANKRKTAQSSHEQFEQVN